MSVDCMLNHLSYASSAVLCVSPFFLFVSIQTDPYPDADTKKSLAEVTHLSYEQVTHWYINARMRFWRPLVRSRQKELHKTRNTKDEKDARANRSTGATNPTSVNSASGVGGTGVEQSKLAPSDMSIGLARSLGMACTSSGIEIRHSGKGNKRSNPVTTARITGMPKSARSYMILDDESPAYYHRRRDG